MLQKKDDFCVSMSGVIKKAPVSSINDNSSRRNDGSIVLVKHADAGQKKGKKTTNSKSGGSYLETRKISKKSHKKDTPMVQSKKIFPKNRSVSMNEKHYNQEQFIYLSDDEKYKTMPIAV